MDLGPQSDADLLQRALDGEQVTDTGILELVAVLHAVTAIDQAGLAPTPTFVSDLRARLLADDAGTALLPAIAPTPGPSDASAASDPTDPATPSTRPLGSRDASTQGSPTDDAPKTGSVSVLRISARPVKYLAAAAASILIIGSLLGVASRSAAPGDALYPIKQVLDRAAVELAGSPIDEGRTHLAQAQQHISEARDLIDRGSASAADINEAFDAASASTREAQQQLLGVYRSEHRADALTELADFYTRARPQVDAMKARVPAESLAAWQRLRDLLGAGELDTLRELAACTICGDRAAEAAARLGELVSGSSRGGLPLPGSTTTPGGTASGLPGVPGVPGATLPTDLPTSGLPTGVPTAPSTTLPGGISVSVPPVTLPGGGTVSLPTVGVSSTAIGGGGGGVTVPGATISLPTLGVSSTVVVGGGGVTLPGATVPLPTISIPLTTLLGTGGLLP